MNEIKNIDIDQLVPHPLNSKIYQVGNIDELAGDIKQSEWIKPLTVTPKDDAYLIVSGHRRHQAGLSLGLDVMPCEVVELTEDWQILERLLLENQYREKGNETRLREYPYKKEVAAARARLRMLDGVKIDPKENFPEGSKGQARDEAAKEVGIGSGKTAETGRKVIEKSDELREAGEYVKADLLIAAVNKSISGAANLLKIVDDLEEDQAAIYEDEIARGDSTVSNVLKEVKKVENTEKRKDRDAEQVRLSSQTPIVFQKDCLDAIDDIGEIDLLLTDPPYFTDGNFINHISRYLRKVKPTGQAYVFAGADPEEIKAYLSIDSGHMQLVQMIVWNYNNTGQRQPNMKYTSNYQVAFYFRGPEAENINKPADGKEQYACQTINAPDARQNDRFHKWQKPDELIKRLVMNSSKEGDFIFDPFAGSGTHIVMAAKLGRRAEGCEIDPGAIKICIQRGCKNG
jgi:DNA modification methylase/ParB-like chromosome segregation protein Spo0J